MIKNIRAQPIRSMYDLLTNEAISLRNTHIRNDVNGMRICRHNATGLHNTNLRNGVHKYYSQLQLIYKIIKL